MDRCVQAPENTLERDAEGPKRLPCQLRNRSSLRLPARLARSRRPAYDREPKSTHFFSNPLGGFVLYVGVEKTEPPTAHDSKDLYVRVLLEAIKRIDQFCMDDRSPPDNFLLVDCNLGFGTESS